MNYWLVKSEPEAYSWAELVKDGQTAWTGVRNFTARNNLRAMAPGDGVLFYHSGEDKEIVGLAKVVKAAYPDPTAREGDWSCVDLAPMKEMVLAKLSRLSVSPVTEKQFNRVLELAGTKI